MTSDKSDQTVGIELISSKLVWLRSEVGNYGRVTRSNSVLKLVRVEIFGSWLNKDSL